MKKWFISQNGLYHIKGKIWIIPCISLWYDKDSFLESAKPLIKWLNENANPHAKVIVDTASAELLSGEIGVETFEFVAD